MKLILVEDSELIRGQLLHLLAREARIQVVGYATEEEAAVALILATAPDAVLLDLSLAPGSGLKVLERIRAGGSGARVLVLTNNTTPKLHEACMELGAAGVFDKSADADKCLAQLFSWLPPLPENESRRLEALSSVRLLDSPEQEVFDNLARLTADVTETPIALICLVDKDRQWFLSHIGLAARETSRSIAFCAHSILQNELMEVPDATLDQRFCDNPLVVGKPYIRFYAGVPLVLPSGEALGTLCVIDDHPRQLTARQRQAIKTLASSVLSEIELRRRVIYLEQEVERRRQAEAHILHLATRDPLTALPNRSMLRDRLAQHLRLALRGRGNLGVLFIDLDRFKPINDTLGHDVGDDVLVMVAERLNDCLRSSDTVGRLGGDEFAVVLPDIAGSADALLVTGKIIEALNNPIYLKGQHIHIGASIGVAMYPEHGSLGDQLLRHADLAMYQAKHSGGGRACLFSRQLSEHAEQMQGLENDLRDALVRRELLLHFQPQITLDQLSLCGVEALVRWNHPHLGLLPPDHFIPLAEERGFIDEIGRQVLDMALTQLKAWDDMGVPVPRIAVNFAPSEIRDDFAERVEAALFRHSIAPHRLELEITESMLFSDGVEPVSLLRRLRTHGVSISIDDFGVGYSSLGQIRRMPIDSLKIDRSFIKEVETSPHDLAIVKAVLTMAESLGLRVVAEGVEGEGQMALLQQVACPCVQGDFLTCALPPEEVVHWLKAFAASGD